MPKKYESKHDAFRRLMKRRGEEALDKLRLVSQLGSGNYENTPEEAEEVVYYLDAAVNHVARVFGVPYASVIGEADRRVPAAVVSQRYGDD